MFKNKHSGWTHELRRTPFGGGGGWFDNALHSVTDAVSGWDPHITEGTGDWLTENGWMIPLAMITAGAASAMGGGAIAAGEIAGEGAVAGSGGAIAADGTVFAAGEAIPAGTAMSSGSFAGAGAGAGMVDASGNIIGGGAEGASMGSGASSVGQAAYDSAIAGGASQSAAQAAADSAYNSYLTTAGQYTAAGGSAGNLTPEMIAYANASADPIGSINAIAGMTPEEFSSYTQLIGGAGNASGFTAGEDLAQLMQSHPDLTQAQLENILKINYGTDPMLSADAANLASQGYNAGTIDQVLGYSYSNPELAGTGIESSAANPASGMNLSDTLKRGKNASDIAKLLKQGATSGLTSSLGKLAQGSTPMGASQLQVVRGNQNPFTYQQQQPIQDTRQAQLAKLLQQG